jgi:hypothetical protein
MAAEITTVSRDLIWSPQDVQRLWFFPDGSRYLRYSSHFHMIFKSGFRQNLPLMHWTNPLFVVVYNGKLSVKNFWGTTIHKIEVIDQVWYYAGGLRAPKTYALVVPGSEEYRRRRRRRV